MRVILKPAGLLCLLGVILLLTITTITLAQRKKPEETLEMPAPAVFKALKVEKDPVFDSPEQMQPVNLSEIGAKDWVHWGLDNKQVANRKATGSKAIGDVKPIQEQVGFLPTGKKGPSRGFFWTDGAPQSKVKLTYDGLHAGNGNGFRFEVPATAKEQILYVFVGGWKAEGVFGVFLSDGTRPTMEKHEVALEKGYYSRTYRVRFASNLPNQKLQVVWRLASGEGNISLQGAALR